MKSPESLYLCFVLVSLSEASFRVPNLPMSDYTVHGDIKLGGIFRIHEYSGQGLCGDEVHGQKLFQYAEAMVHAIHYANNIPHVLPNISLGFTILDSCTKDQVALARTLNFLPPASCCNCSQSSDAPHYDVVGVVSGSNSGNTIAAAELLNLFHIPMVGAVSTSETLSDKTKYEYFLRVVPSDLYQAKAIIDILLHFNWTYISAINSPGSYGQTGIKTVKDLADQNGICVAYAREVNIDRGDDDYDEIVRNLIRNKEAKAVVLFVQGSHGRGIIKAAQKVGAVNMFIWLTSDSVSPSGDMVDIEDTGAGGFFMQLYSTGASGFPEHFENLSPLNDTNPWLGKLWKEEFHCEVDSLLAGEQTLNPIECGKTTTTSDCKREVLPTCNKTITMGDIPGYSPYAKTALFRDTVMTFAYGIHNMISETCPEAFNDKSVLRECVHDGPLLLQYMKNVTFDGSYGRVQFDERGDADGKYQIDQLQKINKTYVVKTIGMWDKSTQSLSLPSELYWNVVGEDGGIPESVCSRPCAPGEYYVQLELRCCWDCRPCREYEIVVDNNTKCQECEELYWPDEETYMKCVEIPPTYLKWDEALPLVCLILSLLGMSACACVLILYFKNWEVKLIKATSRELSLMALTGTVLAYVTVIFLVDRPKAVSCYFARIGFNLSFAVAYAPLLAKTSRIYRIFAAAKRGMKSPSFISSRTQVILSTILITLQVIVSVITIIISPPNVDLQMPVTSKKYVEMLCDLPMPGLIAPLAYNLLLILCCSFYAFKARTLPDNFNESRYIFLSVCTTIFLWFAFIPTYFTAFYATQKTLLLACILLLNPTVMLLCLYIPKLYAIYMVDEDLMSLASNTATTGVSMNQPKQRFATFQTSTGGNKARVVPVTEADPENTINYPNQPNYSGHM